VDARKGISRIEFLDLTRECVYNVRILSCPSVGCSHVKCHDNEIAHKKTVKDNSLI
jgi:hypothetical protein